VARVTYLADDELGESYILRYLALKAAGRIGAVWLGHRGLCFLAPAGAFHPFNERVVVTIADFRKLIDELDPAAPAYEAPRAHPAKIAPQSIRALPSDQKAQSA
jgi:hypothetical protein